MEALRYIGWGVVALIAFASCQHIVESQPDSCDIIINARGTWEWQAERQTGCWFPAGMEFREDGTWVAVP